MNASDAILTALIFVAALPYSSVGHAGASGYLAAIAGGLIGAEYGSRRLGNPAIKKLLALVLAIAGAKMILTA